MIPPKRKITEEKSTARVAERTRSSPNRVNRNAITTVAKTSKKPSTHRCTTHDRAQRDPETEVTHVDLFSPNGSRATAGGQKPRHRTCRDGRSGSGPTRAAPGRGRGGLFWIEDG